MKNSELEKRIEELEKKLAELKQSQVVLVRPVYVAGGPNYQPWVTVCEE